MTVKNKSNPRHSNHGGHKGQGHGWMMLVCVLVMLGVVFLSYSDSTDVFSFALMGSALIPLILCLLVHGLMMKLMMSDCFKDKASDSESELNNSEQNTIQREKSELKTDRSRSFNA
ncbi:hypothetical protein C1N32_00850 [Vibrio diazotrophicus]|uniref:DUF2933 domain-containing protein n=1 Tax=Vibrio diazotrophicus TaxID=685 RepID=A0A2J8I7W7_VIBDI|nr:hypothetical protein [Vibrio diazotrophicus]PNI06591.1 hypothetical protein C1N32_00850 [Vibrio diazotrophicus]